MKKVMSILLVIVLLLTGCVAQSDVESNAGNNESNASNDASNASNTSNAEKKIKDTLIVAQGAEPTILDPHVGKDSASVAVHRNIFDTLTTFDEDMNLIGSVAESWEVISDKSTKFNIRKDMVFHNGQPLTSEDVKFSLERACVTPAIKHLVGFIETIEIVDDYTVIVNSKEPFAAVLGNLASPPVAIVCKSAVEELGDKAFENPIGTGPYKFVEWKHGEYVKLEAFEDYHLGKSSTNNIIIRTIPEAAQRTIGLETNEVDIAYAILPNDKPRIVDNKDLILLEKPSLSVTYLMLNNKKEFLQDKLVRQAIRHAIDIETIVEVIASGVGTPAPNIIAPGIFGYNEDLKIYDYDIAKAKELLSKSNYPNGFEMTLYTADAQVRVEIAQVLQSQLEEIGVKVEIVVLEYGVFYEKIANGEHDMAIFGFITPTGDAEYAFSSLFHSKNHGIAGNRAFYSNPKVDDLIDVAKSNLNTEERLKMYYEVQEIVYDESPYIPLYIQNLLVGTSSKVEGFAIHPTDYNSLYNVTCYE